MNAADWARAEQLFHRVAAMRPEERAAALASCEDADVRAEVESLLANSDDADAPGTLTAIAGVAADFGENNDPDQLRIGQRIGPYQIDSIIGHGGMGAVFSASRVDD